MKTSWNKLSFLEKIFFYSKSYLRRAPFYFSKLLYKNLEVVDGKIKLKFVNLGSNK